MNQLTAVLAAGCLGGCAAPLLRRVVVSYVGGPVGALRLAGWLIVALLTTVFAVPAEVTALTIVVLLSAVGVMLAHIDLARRILPDALVLPSYPLLGAVVIIGGITTENPDAMLRACTAAAAGLAGYALLAIGGGMGYGDVKLAGLLGLGLGWISWQSALLAAITGFAVATVTAVPVLLSRRADTTIAFGPSMLLGGLIAVPLT